MRWREVDMSNQPIYFFLSSVRIDWEVEERMLIDFLHYLLAIQRSHTQGCLWEKAWDPCGSLCPKSSKQWRSQNTICSQKALRHAGTNFKGGTAPGQLILLIILWVLSLVYNLSRLEQGCLKAARWNATAWKRFGRRSFCQHSVIPHFKPLHSLELVNLWHGMGWRCLSEAL